MSRETHHPGREARAGARLPVPLLVVLVVGAMSVLAAAAVAARGDADARDRQATLLQNAARSLEARLVTVSGRLAQLSQGLGDAAAIDRTSFERHAAPMITDEGIVAATWMPLVRDRDRTAYERRTGRHIVDGNGSALGRVDRRTIHAPVTFLTGTAAARRVGRVGIGFDVAAAPARLRTLLAVRDDGRPRSLPPLRLPAAARHLGVAVVSPVYRRGAALRTLADRRRALVGWVSAVHSDTAIGRAVGVALPAGVGVGVSVDGVALPLGGPPVRQGRTERFRSVGRAWTVTVGRPDRGNGALVATIGSGASLTLLLGLLSLVAARRESYALEMVDARLAERDAAERSREALESRLATVFEQSPIGMALAGLDGRIVRVNRVLCDLTGREPGELEGMRLEALVHPRDRAAGRDAVAALVEGSIPAWSIEQRLLHAAGHTVWAAVDVAVVSGGAGRPEHLVASVQDITERRRYEERLRYLADHDPLTGLLNRRSLDRELTRKAAEAERYGPDGALLVIDLDHFKLVNDSLGHHVGDELIARVAVALTERMRETDTIARLGGDEFAVLLPHGGEEEALAVAESVRDVVAAQPLVGASGRARSISASVGIVMIRGGMSAEEMLVDADLAMYDAKERGRGRTAVYCEEVHGDERMKSRLTWVERVRDALATDAFELHAQPIQEIATGEVVRYELLIRMRSPDGDIIPPGAFLDVAARFDLMPAIDRWVVAHAIELVKAHGADELSVTVNLSGVSIGDPELLAVIEHELSVHGVDPAALVFELTETSAVADLPRAQAFATRLNELGCGVALDDFGAGFGNFFYLKHLPFDVIKIDGEFVRNAATSPTDRLVVEAVAGIARGLGKRTVAEYVSSEATLELMRELRIDFAQGFHTGRPEPVAAWLERAGGGSRTGRGRFRRDVP